MVTLFLLGSWIILKSYISTAAHAKTVLSISAITNSLALLRYASIEKELGNLVGTVISMSWDLFAFAVVYVIVAFGFGVALRAMFQHDDASDMYSGFRSSLSTALTLFDATVSGESEHAVISSNNPAFEIGLIIEITFLVLTAIILLNLLIAKMSFIYEKNQESSSRDWQFGRAKIVKRFLLVGESCPLNMLPVPLNLLTTLLAPAHYGWINITMYVRS